MLALKKTPIHQKKALIFSFTMTFLKWPWHYHFPINELGYMTKGRYLVKCTIVDSRGRGSKFGQNLDNVVVERPLKRKINFFWLKGFLRLLLSRK